jgi:hypothetical protein
MTVIAHNGKGFDFQFVIKYLLSKTNFKIGKSIVQGSNYMYFTTDGLRFVDSLNFLGMSLKDFTKTFDLKELKKDIFPIYSIHHRIGNIKVEFLI